LARASLNREVSRLGDVGITKQAIPVSG
jgi:hypothetical protein